MNSLPPVLLAWLQSVFPGLPEVRLLFVAPFTGSDGLTLGRTVRLRPPYQERLNALDPAAIELLCHELVHVEQFARAGWLWPLHYLLGRRRLENNAYQRARELRAMWESKGVQSHAQVSL